MGSKRGCNHGMSRSRVYKSWEQMKARCGNPRSHGFHRYGGRGIKVCKRWLESFTDFYEDMGDRPEGMSLDRKDTDGDYDPSNCRWATRKEQNRNRRDNINLTIDGETKCAAEWADQHCVPLDRVYYRYKQGWPHDECVFGVWKITTKETTCEQF